MCLCCLYPQLVFASLGVGNIRKPAFYFSQGQHTKKGGEKIHVSIKLCSVISSYRPRAVMAMFTARKQINKSVDCKAGDGEDVEKKK